MLSLSVVKDYTTVVVVPPTYLSRLELLSELSRLFEWDVAAILLSLNLLSRLILERAFFIYFALDDSRDSKSSLEDQD